MAAAQERVATGTVQVHADASGYEAILTPPALDFLARLHRRFDPVRQ